MPASSHVTHLQHGRSLADQLSSYLDVQGVSGCNMPEGSHTLSCCSYHPPLLPCSGDYSCFHQVPPAPGGQVCLSDLHFGEPEYLKNGTPFLSPKRGA